MKVALRVSVILLVMIGVTSAIGRAIFAGDLGHRLQAIRVRLGYPPFPDEVVMESDVKFVRLRPLTLLHVVPGGIFLLLAPIQFIPAMRRRYLRAHRWLGRALIIAVLLSGAAGMFFGVFQPIGGVPEAIGIEIFGTLLFICVIRAFVAIRRGNVAMHREWMIRSFAVALAISTVRLVEGAFDFAHVWANNPRAQFVLSIWSGWLITLAIAEIWIRYSRGRFSLDSFSSPSQQLPMRIPVPELPSIARDASSS